MAGEFSPPNFPREGRGDALGGQFGTLSQPSSIFTIATGAAVTSRGSWTTTLRLRYRPVDDCWPERPQDIRCQPHDPDVPPDGHAAGRTNRQPRGDQPAYRRTGGRADIRIPSDKSDRGYAVWGLQTPRGQPAPNRSPSALSPPSSPRTARRCRMECDDPPLERSRHLGDLDVDLEDEDLDDQALMRIDSGAVDVIGTDIFQRRRVQGVPEVHQLGPGGGWPRRLLGHARPHET